MANRDHTVGIRPSVPADGTLTPESVDPSPPGMAWPESLRLSTLDDVALAVFAMTRLRYDSERCRLAQARGIPAKPREWPLSAAEASSLGVAIDCLRQYGRQLGHEPRVKIPPVR